MSKHLFQRRETAVFHQTLYIFRQLIACRQHDRSCAGRNTIEADLCCRVLGNQVADPDLQILGLFKAIGLVFALGFPGTSLIDQKDVVTQLVESQRLRIHVGLIGG